MDEMKNEIFYLNMYKQIKKMYSHENSNDFIHSCMFAKIQCKIYQPVPPPKNIKKKTMFWIKKIIIKC